MNTSSGERLILEAKTNIKQDLTRTEYIDLVYKFLHIDPKEVPVFNTLKLNQARQLAIHLKGLNIELKE
jgi:hypothetical protein